MEKVFYACLSSQQEVAENIWYMDSGCSNHMTGHKEMFVDLAESYSSEVRLGDGLRHKITGIGAVVVKSKEGKISLIRDVYLVPDLTQNLSSVGQLMQKNDRVDFDDDDHCTIIDKRKNLIVAKTPMTSNKIFPLSLRSTKECALQSTIDDDQNIWHLRYDHLNYKGLILLKK